MNNMINLPNPDCTGITFSVNDVRKCEKCKTEWIVDPKNTEITCKGLSLILARQLNKRDFIYQLAKFLVEDQATMSIKLQMGNEDARKWSILRSYTPLQGYLSVDEAETVLTKWLLA